MLGIDLIISCFWVYIFLFCIRNKDSADTSILFAFADVSELGIHLFGFFCLDDGVEGCGSIGIPSHSKKRCLIIEMAITMFGSGGYDGVYFFLGFGEGLLQVFEVCGENNWGGQSCLEFANLDREVSA